MESPYGWLVSQCRVLLSPVDILEAENLFPLWEWLMWLYFGAGWWTDKTARRVAHCMDEHPFLGTSIARKHPFHPLECHEHLTF